MKFTTHGQLINYVIQKRGLGSYLEIGLHRGETFREIECKLKISVDPSNKFATPTFHGTSDDFFRSNTQTFDCIFIDGLHWWEQVRKDFENSFKCLNPGGIIFIHDTDPKEERFSVYPRREPRRWNGDVMLFLQHLSQYPVDWRTPDMDANGLTVVKERDRPAFDFPFTINNWKEFIEYRNEVLQPVSVNEFLEWIS